MLDQINSAGVQLRAVLDDILPDVATRLRRSGVQNSTATDDVDKVVEGNAADIVARMQIDQIMGMIAMSHPGLSADQMMAIRATLESMSGKQGHAEMLQVAEDSARRYVIANEQQTQSLLPEQRLKMLWSDYEHRDKENADEFERLYQCGLISREQLEYMRQERARLNELPKEGEERISGEKAFVEYQHALGLRVIEEAHAKGNSDAEQATTKILENTTAQKQELGEIHLLNSKEYQRESVTEEIEATRFFEEEMDTSNLTRQKMEVSDVTPNDVKAPTGAKDRQVQKSEGKT